MHLEIPAALRKKSMLVFILGYCLLLCITIGVGLKLREQREIDWKASGCFQYAAMCGSKHPRPCIMMADSAEPFLQDGEVVTPTQSCSIKDPK